MRTSPVDGVIDHLRRTGTEPDGAGTGDGELLDRFIESHDEAAFAALVNRHGPMVWGVCRRLLPRHDAEDAFQATFLVLARKAASIRSKATAVSWLYGVARRTALHARRTAARRRAKEVQVMEMPDTAAAEPDVWADLRAVLDEEVSGLSAVYRAVLVLCDLEGLTRTEVARRLGVPEGTVAGRLARARAMLAKRLGRRGIVFSSAVAAVWPAGAAAAPPALVASTTEAASRPAAGVASANVAALTEGVVKAMFASKLRAAVPVVLVLGLVATGATFLTYCPATGQDDNKPTVEKAVGQAAKRPKEKVTAWGKEVDGVRVGLQLGEDRVYKIGETVTVTVRLRNDGKTDVPFVYHEEHFQKRPPLVTDADGKAVKIRERSIFGIIKRSSLAPGKEIDLCSLMLDIRPDTDRIKDECWTLYGTGKFHIQYQDVPVVGEPRLDAPAATHATGKLELEVREAR